MIGSVVVVGASLAGMHAAHTLRRHGFDGSIVVIDADAATPYDRPPLSKQVLAGEWEPDRIVLPAATEDLDLDLRLGRRAMALDLTDRFVRLDGGERVGYDGLVVATGAAARRLPGTEDLAGVHVLRTLDDCLTLRAELDEGPRRVVVVGAGFIGAEVAATCRGRGLEVTLLEAAEVPLELALGREIGAVTADLHRDHGVDVRLGVGVDGLEGDERVEGVRLADGTVIAASVVVVGIGVRPNTAWMDGSGLNIDDGLVCDETLLAAPGVVVAGDIAPLAVAALRRVPAGRALGDGGADGWRRGRAPAGRGRTGRAPAVRSRALVLERPVRPQDPARRSFELVPTTSRS